MKSHDIRQSFLDFFTARGHREIASAPLVAHGDPTLHFTNAGMVPFKDVFLGLSEPAAPRAVTVQKCLRVSGKHNDLENVGPSPRHHTFFEMLGNFSFGDYFKDDAVRFAWELVTGPWGLDPAHLFATVYEEDDDAAALWAKHSSLPPARILRCGQADNFWQMGATGPCGPCSEVFVDLHPRRPAADWDEGTDSGRYLEIWNLVFMQFDRDEAGELHPLPDPSIDTGAGLERVAATLQGVGSNYETDLFLPILHAAADLAGTGYGEGADGDVSLRVIADHLRAVSFLLADGVIPAADGRGYVLRRLLRRAVRHGMRLGFEEPFLHRLVPVLGEVMGGRYPELDKTREASRSTVRAEEEKYLATLAAGARHIQEAIDRARHAGHTALSGPEIFQLYDTYGQELDTVREIAEEERLGLDEEGYEKLMDGVPAPPPPTSRSAWRACVTRCRARSRSRPRSRATTGTASRARASCAWRRRRREAPARPTSSPPATPASRSSTARSSTPKPAARWATAARSPAAAARPRSTTPRRTPRASTSTSWRSRTASCGWATPSTCASTRSAGSPSSVTIRPPTCFTRRSTRCSARARGKRARSSPRTACASTSTTTGR
jgi:alanyl-tRNA synthetase